MKKPNRPLTRTFPDDTTPFYYVPSADLYMDALEGEIRWLRNRISNWAERLQWTDGLDTCVEEMRKEINQ